MTKPLERRASISESLTKRLGSVLSPAGRGARLAVFSYHQVLRETDALRPDEPSRAEFARDVDVIGRVFTVMPLVDAVRRLSAGTLPARAACITFDDGYANNYDLAAPILERAGLPATFFIAAGAVDDGIMWNDLVIEAVARSRGPMDLRGIPGLDAEALSGLEPPSLVDALLARLKYQPLEQRLESAERLFRNNAGGSPPRLMMTRERVAELARRGFDVGGHTTRHPILKELPDDEARREIESCTAWIEAVTGQAPRSFAYPNGRPGKDFDAVHASMVADAGYEVAVTTAWGLARRGTDTYRIPRVGPWWRRRSTLSKGFLRIYLRSLLPQGDFTAPARNAATAIPPA